MKIKLNDVVAIVFCVCMLVGLILANFFGITMDSRHWLAELMCAIFYMCSGYFACVVCNEKNQISKD